MTTSAASDRTEVGNYFIANYPPFSAWKKEAVETDARPALAAPPTDVPLGLYLHIPFCRKRCHFCYFRVYTDKNASEVQGYLDVLAREWELYSAQPAIAGRPLNFVYFGGGTPSYISTAQLEGLVAADGRRSARGARRRRSPSSASRGRSPKAKLARHPQHRRDPAQPRRRELRRRDPGGERARAPLR